MLDEVRGFCERHSECVKKNLLKAFPALSRRQMDDCLDQLVASSFLVKRGNRYYLSNPRSSISMEGRVTADGGVAESMDGSIALRLKADRARLADNPRKLDKAKHMDDPIVMPPRAECDMALRHNGQHRSYASQPTPHPLSDGKPKDLTVVAPAVYQSDVPGVSYHKGSNAWRAKPPNHLRGRIKEKQFKITRTVTFDQAKALAEEAARVMWAGHGPRKNGKGEAKEGVPHSDVTGVRWDPYNRCWQARYHVDGKERSKCFYPSAFNGDVDAARRAAEEFRASKETAHYHFAAR
ncbi:unnamed protein product [Vitrella brassicaformis CCMP3155]|uniref:AP2/ERF domain-containing protein n=1 Tax=Vitrella brassicaformis (strain CCMP3155) TaxID=1169540 RepID=A0A0G4FQK1_VITBC|nr:unnamed protein product [Vitrella brassicaformis CCMP3155]|mmetsp:Transcript_5379/g.12639  ORF Transcript_5379/g.12639 Transcript_5379/m.12639 type:complete len:294 (-) Transcript_5379:191-1072(-)|eukprot:CEM16283.1 unnamed protein product [Vitrella brassicaformis CCMP3155]